MNTVTAVITHDTKRKFILLDSERVGNPDQLQLDFTVDKEKWITESLEIAALIPADEFYFSELKARLGKKPLHYNSYGALGHAMKQAGFVQVQEWKTTKSGNRDYKWRKLCGN